MDFPAVTVCNFNPIKKSYVQKLNSSGDLSIETLDYLMETNTDVMVLYSNLNRSTVEEMNQKAEAYMDAHKDFNVINFLNSSGYECEEMFVRCYFGGTHFDCCKYVESKILSLGKCYTIDFSLHAPDWMHKQVSSGVEAGLQIIVDAHLEEVLDNDKQYEDILFSDIYENGFRYYIHESNRDPELASEGISVSPSRTVYSAIKKTTHNLLQLTRWGNCTDSWPLQYSSTNLPYTSIACRSLCLAQYFYEQCGCSPFTYNIDGQKPMCTPYQTITCMDSKMAQKLDQGLEFIDLPNCTECHIECDSIKYESYNSYGDGFKKESLEWLRSMSNHSENHIIKNVAIINIFFMEMFYTSYSQVQAMSLTEMLSDIGGNMGLFMGISVITITELILFCVKITWILASSRRRDYMSRKRRSEKERKRDLHEAVDELRSRRNSRFDGVMGAVNEMSFINNGTSDFESILELKLDIEDLRKRLNKNDGVTRYRLPSEKSNPPTMKRSKF
ncbi:unnamed protein product [Caenorhabditis angaria]|uniref:Uncharacterized protein n=1 Tax=Caenorhabditis angaria TaxID=860376 RepID=A0A9P1I7V3_9PELO|nr:unnamed protein product [Caenorhabditis angaria]